MTLLWPPRPLGLGTPLSLAALSGNTRANLGRDLLRALAFGVAAVVLVLGADLLFFHGITLRRFLNPAAHTSLPMRVVVSIYDSIFEEGLFRVILASVVAWLGYLILSLFVAKPERYAEWLGTLAAAAVMGLWWHLSAWDDPFNVARVVTANMIVGCLYGWLYWRKGLESAIVAHFAVYVCTLIVIPALR